MIFLEQKNVLWIPRIDQIVPFFYLQQHSSKKVFRLASKLESTSSQKGTLVGNHGIRLHLINSTSASNTDPRLRAAIGFVQGYFEPTNKSNIEECMNQGFTLMVYGADNHGHIHVMSAINFVLSNEGAYVNYMATAAGLYNKALWPEGDDLKFRERGLCNHMFLIIKSFLSYVSTSASKDNSLIYFQSHPSGESFEYYRKRHRLSKDQSNFRKTYIYCV